MLFDGTVLRAEYSNPSVATIRSYIIKENWLPRDMGIVAIGAHHRATVTVDPFVQTMAQTHKLCI